MALINSLISFNNVNLNFGGVNALTEVSFDIKEKSLFAIIGPNGAGKTSIFNCISGIYRPTSGIVKIFDQDIKTMRPDAIANLGVSRTFQNIELFHQASVLQNLLVARQTHRKSNPVSEIEQY